MQQSAAINWLQQHNISGVNVSFDELLMYRNYTYLLSNRPNYNLKHQLSGQYLAKTKGRGMEFDEARHYQPGDDVRAIDWRVTARTGKTHTKVFREEKDRPIFVLCDLLPSMKFGSQLLFKSVQACHLSALIAWKAKQNGDKIGGLVLSENNLFEAKPRSRQQAVLNWLNALKEEHARPNNEQASNPEQLNKKFVEACAHLRRVAHPGSLVYIVSDFQHLNEQSLQHLYQLQKHCEVVACWINDPLEQKLPEMITGQMPITDGTQTKLITNKNQLAEFNQNVSQYFQQQKQALTQYQIKWLTISAGIPLEEQL